MPQYPLPLKQHVSTSGVESRESVRYKWNFGENMDEFYIYSTCQSPLQPKGAINGVIQGEINKDPLD
ncbi:hypothetical protein NQ317_002943, partial [Molorchus minor]